MHIVDDEMMQTKVYGDVSIVDSETGESVDITLTPGLMAQYKKLHEALCLKMEAYCVPRHMLYFRTPVSEPFDEIVLQVFRAGGFLT